MNIYDTLFHKTLIAAGFTYHSDIVPPGRSLAWRHSWVNKEIYFCTDEHVERMDITINWTSRIIQTGEVSPYHNWSSAEIISHFQKETKMTNDKITPENIEEVLRYNDISPSQASVRNNCVQWFGEDHGNSVNCYFNSPTWLAHLELETGKLKSLPKFGFEEYLSAEYSYTEVEERLGLKFFGNGMFGTGDYAAFFPMDKHNADCLIEACQVLEGLV